MRLDKAKPGDIAIIRGGIHPIALARIGLAHGDHVVQVSEPLAGGVGVAVLEAFSGEPLRDGYTIADEDAEVVEVLEPTRYPRTKEARAAAKARGEDVIDPLRRRHADLADASHGKAADEPF